jgi:integrase
MQTHVKLRQRFSTACLQAGLRRNTELSYWDWSRKFVKSIGAKSDDDLKRSPDVDVSAFLTEQARRGCAASTQAQALNALNFLYVSVLRHPLGKLEFKRPNRPARLPSVPVSHDETMRLLDALPQPINLITRLIYGAALRVNDCLRIRLRDLDFANNELRIMDSKGGKDRLVPLPIKLREELMALVTLREAEHLVEKRAGKGWVWLPDLYGIKNPKAHYDSGWQYLFAARDYVKDPRSENHGRHHITPEAVQTAMRKASAKLKLKRNVTPHGLRHSSARRMKEKGVPLHFIQQVLGHDDPATTMRYLGLGETIPQGISPLDP